MIIAFLNKISNLTAWILNSDVTPVDGYTYVWDDSAAWDDDAIWKD